MLWAWTSAVVVISYACVDDRLLSRVRVVN